MHLQLGFVNFEFGFWTFWIQVLVAIWILIQVLVVNELESNWIWIWFEFGFNSNFNFKLQVSYYLKLYFEVMHKKKGHRMPFEKQQKKVGAKAPTFYNKHKIAHVKPIKKWVKNNFQSNFSSCFILKTPFNIVPQY